MASWCGIEQALKRNVVNGHDHRWRGLPGPGEIGRNQPGLPVMRVDHVWLPSVQTMQADFGACIAQGGESQMIVRPVRSVGPEVDASCAIVEMWSDEEKEFQSFGVCRPDFGLASEEVLVSRDWPAGFGENLQFGIGRNQDPDTCPDCGKSLGYCSNHIRQPTGLDERRTLRGDEKDVHVSSPADRSSIA